MPRKPATKTVRLDDGTRRVINRNSNGEDSLYWLESKQAWRATFMSGGKRRTVQAPTREQAIARRDAAVAAGTKAKGAGPASFSEKTTIGVLAAWWLDSVVRHRVRIGTLESNTGQLARCKTLHDRPIGEVRLEELIAWQSAMLDRYTPGVVASTRGTLSALFNACVDLGIITGNPVQRLKPPKTTRKHGRSLSVDEVAPMIAACAGVRHGEAAILLFTQGNRASEILGLAWSDIDFEQGTATVRRAVTTSDTYGTRLGPTKTPGAEGVHYLSAGNVARLRALRARQAAERLQAGPLWVTHHYDGQELALVFTADDGALVGVRTLNRAVKKAARVAGLDPVGVSTHCGRRTVITSLYQAGEQLSDIQHHIGHHDPRVTQRYITSNGSRPQRTAAFAAQLLDPAATG